MDLSVIIVNWNTKALLLDCLRTVEANRVDSPGRAISVYVVDNGSTDGSPAAVREAFPDVHVIETGKNLGFAAGNNVALKLAKSRYALLLNSDTLVPLGVLSGLIRNMDERPEIGVCSPLLLNADGSAQICWARFQNVVSEITGQLDRSQSPYPLNFYDQIELRATMSPFVVDWVGGACFMVRAEAVREVGLMDEKFFMYSEETEWCHRFAKHGWQTLMIPVLTVTHLGGQSSKAVPLATRQRMYRSILRLYRILYGEAGSIPPSIVAAARYALFQIRHRLRKAPKD
jgi:GT2 family glycosyltransferase